LDAGQTPHLGLTGFVFSISERSADISWLPRVPVSQAAAGAAAAAGVAAPDGRPGPPDAAAEAVGPAEEVAGTALLSAPPDAVAAEPGARVQRVRPAARVLKAQPQGSLTEAAGELPWAFAPFQAFSSRPRHRTPVPPEASSSGWSSPICFQD
jgi:hypothetical protein